jgi:hypothetical protein
MRFLVNASRFMCAALCLTACGGGSTGPTSLVGVSVVSASPPPGSTLTLVPHSNGELSAELSMTFSIVSDQDIVSPAAVVEWGQCALALGDVSSELKPNQPQTLTVKSATWGVPAAVGFHAYSLQDCPLPTNTSTISVSLVCSLCSRDNPGPSFSRELPLNYTFIASTPSGSRYPACGSSGSFPCVDLPSGGGSGTGVCNDGKATCSTDLSTACSSNGALSCVECPGPLCPFPLPPP